MKDKEIKKIHDVAFDFEKKVERKTVTKEDLKVIKSKISDSNNYILKDSSGTNFRTNSEKDVADLLENRNITEVVVEEVKFSGARRSAFQVENSPEEKSKISKNFSGLLSLDYEKMLNNDTKQLLESVEHDGVLSLDSEEVEISRERYVKRTNKIYQRFFRIKNNSEIFKIGKSFLADYSNGMKCFGFSSDGNTESVVKTQYGVASFFNFYSHMRVLIVASKEEIEEWKRICAFDDPREVYDKALDINYLMWETEGISLIEYSSVTSKTENVSYDFMDRLVVNSDVTLCSFPDVKELEGNIGIYFQVLQRVDNLSLVLRKEYSRLKQVKKLVENFVNYKVVIKGVIVG